MRLFPSNVLVLSAIFLCATAGTAVCDAPRVVHVLVALCDNDYQGIVPVPKRFGNGDDPSRNLYWGAMYGVKAFLARSADWKLLQTTAVDSVVLQRCIFRSADSATFLVADAYRGREIRAAVVDFFAAMAGDRSGTAGVVAGTPLDLYQDADLMVYVGHDGLMDFELTEPAAKPDGQQRDAVVLACMSSQYFGPHLKRVKARAVLLTTGLMAPEAYVLEAAVGAWAAELPADSIRSRAAAAYSTYQKCSRKAALSLFTHAGD